MYNILTADFVRGGGDGYSMLTDLKYTVAGNYLQCFKDVWHVHNLPYIWFHQNFITSEYNRNLKKKKSI